MPWHELSLGALKISSWTVFGRAPVLLVLLVLCAAGLRRGLSLRATLVTTAAFAVGAALGTAVLSSIIGALAGGVLVWWLVQRTLGLYRAPLGAVALGLTLLLAFGRIGCLINGCCFGHATGLPRGVRYEAGSAAFILHDALGWLAADATHSLYVHPYPAYESAALFLWAALLPWLARRLRSEGATLSATIAFDLALRSQLDGLRAMVNVPWALELSVLGMNALQLGLRAFALSALACCIWLAAKARGPAAPSAPVAPVRVDGARVPLAYLTLWVCAWLVAGQTTLFLRQLSIGALLVASPALWPARPYALTPVAQRWATGLALLALASLSGLVALANPTGTAARVDPERWSYAVDREHAVLLREKPRDRLWLGAELGAGTDHFRVEDGCSGDYDIYDRRTLGLAVRAEWEHPLSKRSVLWTGLRLGTVREGISKDSYTDDDVLLSAHDLRVTSLFAQPWVEWEHPYFTLGLSGLACRRFYEDDARLGKPSSPQRFCLVPGGHLRAGFSFLGAELGVLDRQSPFGVPQGRLGVSGMFFEPGTIVKHPDAVRFRYFAGAQLYPGAHFGLLRPQPSLSLEATLRAGRDVHVVGGDVFLGDEARALIVRYRIPLADW